MTEYEKNRKKIEQYRKRSNSWLLKKTYETIGTPEECLEAMRMLRACQVQYLDNIKDPLEPLKIGSALKSELLKLQLRKAEKPEDISILDYTVIAALKEALEKRMPEENEVDD